MVRCVSTYGYVNTPYANSVIEVLLSIVWLLVRCTEVSHMISELSAHLCSDSFNWCWKCTFIWM